MQSKHILIVDDEPVYLSVLENVLKGYGELKTVESAAEAIRELNKNPQYDMIICDYHMPDMNGFDLCQHIKGSRRISNIPVLICSSFIEGDAIEFAEMHGADGFIPKPLVKHDIELQVKKFFNN